MAIFLKYQGFVFHLRIYSISAFFLSRGLDYSYTHFFPDIWVIQGCGRRGSNRDQGKNESLDKRDSVSLSNDRVGWAPKNRWQELLGVVQSAVDQSRCQHRGETGLPALGSFLSLNRRKGSCK